MIDGIIQGIEQWYPEQEFWVLHNKTTGDEIVVTHDHLVAVFGDTDGRLVRVKNGFDKYFSAYRQEKNPSGFTLN